MHSSIRDPFLTAASTAALSLALVGAARAQTWEACGAVHEFLGEAQGDTFGSIVRNAGDTDGDGVDDVAVGAPLNEVGGVAAGRGYVYSGATGALLFSLTGSAGENLGFFVQPAGDVDADGRADVIMGAPDLSNSTPGAAYVVSGATGGVLYTFTGEAVGDRFGRSVNGVGDVNADGHDDVGIGAPQHASLGPDRGRAYIYSGSDGSLLYQFDGISNNDRMGAGLAGLGDRNGDGHDDFILGADQGFFGRGRAYVHDGATGTRDCTLFAAVTGGVFGRGMLGGVGDLTGDSVPDFFVTDFADNGLTGRVRVYDGSNCAILYQLTGEATGDTFGTGSGVAGGDVDGDGVPDLAFGALGAGGAGRGQLRLFSGATGASLGDFNGSIDGDGFGFAAAGMGDVDGDGWPDFAGGAPSHDASRGVVYVVSGRPLPPRSTCDGGTHSGGVAATLRHRLSSSLAADELQLVVADAPAGEAGVLFYGRTSSSMPLGGGELCVGGPWYRVPPAVTLGAAGEATIDLDLASAPFAGGPGAVAAGETIHFQFWFRDGASTNGPNLTNALELTFCP